MPFAVGLALCRRLDLNPRWVVEGEGMEAPFVELSELGLPPADAFVMEHGLSFEEGYERLLKAKLTQWAESHSIEEIIFARGREGVEGWARKASIRELEEKLQEHSQKIKSDQESLSGGHRTIALAAKRELELRRTGKTRKRRSFKNRSIGKNKMLSNGKTTVYIPSNVESSLLSHWIARANALLSHRGAKATLARHLGITKQALNAYLTEASAPSAEKALRLLQWVQETEAQKNEGPAGAQTPTGPVTLRRKHHSNEKIPRPKKP